MIQAKKPIKHFLKPNYIREEEKKVRGQQETCCGIQFLYTIDTSKAVQIREPKIRFTWILRHVTCERCLKTKRFLKLAVKKAVRRLNGKIR